MEKLYYQNIHWYDFLIYVAYNFILSFLILRISDAGFSLEKRSRLLLLLQFQLLFIIVLLDIQFHFLPVIADASVYSSMIQSGQYPLASEENILPFYYVSILLNMLSLSSVVIFIFISFFIFILAELFFIASIRRLYAFNSTLVINRFIILNLLFPAVYLFLPSPSRDAYIILGVSIFIYSIVKYQQQGKLMPVIIWGAVVSLIAFKFIPFILFVLTALFILKLPFKKRLYTLGGILLLIICTLIILNAQGINAAWFADKRNQTLFDTGNYVYGRVAWDNYLIMLKDQLLLAGQFLLSPLPVLNGYGVWLRIPFLPETIFIILIILVFAITIRQSIRHHKLLMIILLLFVFYFGSIDNDLDNAIRQRIPAIELLFMMIAGATIRNKQIV